MPLSELASEDRVVGIRSVVRRLEKGELRKVFLSRDAEAELVLAVEEEALRRGVDVEWVEESLLLGRACAISRPAAAAGLRKR
jgi:large subunit ribosomal protein L7A